VTTRTGEGGPLPRDKRGFAFGLCIAVVRPLLVVLTKRDWRGREHVPAVGGCVLVVNHVSEVDPLTIAHFVYDSGRLPRFLGKVEVFDVPVLGRILRAAGQIPVDRRSRDAAKAFGAAVDAVKAGRCVVVYPEGTITRQPDLWPMAGKSGAARIALMTGCPVIPIAQWGPQHVLAPYSRRPQLLPRKVIRVSAGPAVDLSDLSRQQATPALLDVATNRIMDAVTRQLEEIRGEPAPRTRFDPRIGPSRDGTERHE
jgi:1-acyl-sn-glycerol-3-phosphate acyltransferase